MDHCGNRQGRSRTGRTTVGRTGYYNAMASAEAGKSDVLVVEEVSRLNRDATEMMIMARRLNELNVVICTIHGGVLSGMELAVRAQMAEEQSKETGLRVKRGHRSAAEKGRPVGGIAYGYRQLDQPDEHGNRRAIDPEKAKIVLRIYKDIEAGMSTHAIAMALNKEGAPPPGGGGLWLPKAIVGTKSLMIGIARNPIYCGKVVYGKSVSTLIASTGQIKVTPGAESDFIITDAPQFQIVPEDLWTEVQSILDERSGDGVPSNRRHPPYLLSGKVRCARCEGSYTVLGAHMGCTGHLYGKCSNRRRVAREDVERAVLEGLKERVLQPHILGLYLDEYRQEGEKAAAEYADRSTTTQARLQEVDREIANVLAQVRSGAAAGHAAHLLNQELGRLGGQRKQLEREARQGPPPPALSMEADAVTERLSAMLDDLGAALKGPQRDAARARDIIRSFIDKVVVTPIETDGVKPDGRGAGPVRINVEGSLTELLGLASVDCVIQRRGRASATLGFPNLAFAYYVDIAWRSAYERRGSFGDVAVLSKLLDEAYAPIKTQALVEALGGAADPDPPAQPMRRMRVFAPEAFVTVTGPAAASGA